MPARSAMSCVGVPWNPRLANSSAATSTTSSRRSSALMRGPRSRFFVLVVAAIARSKLALTFYVVNRPLPLVLPAEVDGLAALREWDLDAIEVPRHDRVGEHLARLLAQLPPRVALRQVGEREQLHLRLGRQL